MPTPPNKAISKDNTDDNKSVTSSNAESDGESSVGGGIGSYKPKGLGSGIKPKSSQKATPLPQNGSSSHADAWNNARTTPVADGLQQTKIPVAPEATPPGGDITAEKNTTHEDLILLANSACNILITAGLMDLLLSKIARNLPNEELIKNPTNLTSALSVFVANMLGFEYVEQSLLPASFSATNAEGAHSMIYNLYLFLFKFPFAAISSSAAIALTQDATRNVDPVTPPSANLILDILCIALPFIATLYVKELVDRWAPKHPLVGAITAGFTLFFANAIVSTLVQHQDPDLAATWWPGLCWLIALPIFLMADKTQLYSRIVPQKASEAYHAIATYCRPKPPEGGYQFLPDGPTKLMTTPQRSFTESNESHKPSAGSTTPKAQQFRSLKEIWTTLEQTPAAQKDLTSFDNKTPQQKQAETLEKALAGTTAVELPTIPPRTFQQNPLPKPPAAELGPTSPSLTES